MTRKAENQAMRDGLLARARDYERMARKLRRLARDLPTLRRAISAQERAGTPARDAVPNIIGHPRTINE